MRPAGHSVPLVLFPGDMKVKVMDGTNLDLFRLSTDMVGYRWTCSQADYLYCLFCPIACPQTSVTINEGALCELRIYSANFVHCNRSVM